MRRRTFLAGTGTVAVGGSTLLASGGFDRAESQRTATVETVGDDDAYLKLQYRDRDVSCSATVTLVTLTNQFKEEMSDIEVTYATTNNDVSLGDITLPESLSVGESGAVTLDVECSGAKRSTTTVTFDVDVRGDDSSVTAQSRTIEIGCECATTGISSATFCGDLDEGDVDVSVIASEDRVEWDLADGVDGTVDRIVLFGGFGSYDYGNGPFFLNFDGITGDSGSVAVGSEDEAVARGEGEQHPNDPCPSDDSGVKFEIEEDGTVSKVESV